MMLNLAMSWRRFAVLFVLSLLTVLCTDSVARADQGCYVGNAWAGVTDTKLPPPPPSASGAPGAEITTTWTELVGGGPVDLSISNAGRVSMVLDEEFDTTETVVGDLLIGDLPVPIDAEYPVVFTRLIKLNGTVATGEPDQAGPLELKLNGSLALSETGSSVGPQESNRNASYDFSGTYDCTDGKVTLDSSLGSFALEGPPREPEENSHPCSDDGVLPDLVCTPGQIRSFSAARVCAQGYTEGSRFIPAAVRRRVFSEYGVAPELQSSYEVDHLIPFSLGGANSIANLWPQPPSTWPQKDVYEAALWRAVCKRGLTGTEQQNLFIEAQAVFKTDWQQAEGLLSTISQAHLPGPNAPSVATLTTADHRAQDLALRDGRPKVVSLTGFGATEAAWSAHHQLDAALSDLSAGLGYYDPHPGRYPGVRDSDEFCVTFMGGRVAQYFQNFAPGTSQAAATKGVRAFLPSDAKLVAGPHDAGPCAIEIFTSHSLAVKDHAGATKWGVINVTFTSYYATAPSTPRYTGANVESAFVQGGYQNTTIPKGSLGVANCG